MEKYKMSLLKLLSSIFSEIRKPAFQIVSSEQDPLTGLLFLWVKINNKSIYPVKKDPLELLKETNITKGFSEEDHQWILTVLLENQKRVVENKYKNKFRLIKHQFSEQLDEPLIVYKDFKNNIYIKEAREIYSNLSILRDFSSEDCTCIGYIVGQSESEKDFNICNRKSNIIKFDTSICSGG